MKKIEIQGKKVFIDGIESILYGGEFQYFRIPFPLWENSIKKLSEAGLNFISFYIPWIWHEYEEGKFDFEGTTLPERNLKKLLEIIKSYNINIIVRPGPYIYAEYQGFGVPNWLREKHSETLIIYENGTKSNEFSVMSEVFLNYTEKWYQNIFNFLKPYFEEDLIFACQIDNETGLPQFGNAPFMSDMNPYTIEKYRSYLKNKFNTIEGYNEYTKTFFPGFSDILPPVKNRSNKLEFRAYAEFIEEYFYEYLTILKAMIEKIGIKTFFYLNDPYLCQWPQNSIKKSSIAPVGYDVYPKFTTSPDTHDLPFVISYISEYFDSIMKNMPTIGAEVGVGWFDPRVKTPAEATMQLAMNILARNTRILAYYILQDCTEADGVNWVFEAPIDIAGNTNARYDYIKKVGEFLNKNSNLIVSSKEIYSSVGIAIYTFPSLDMVKANVNFRNVSEEANKGMIRFNGGSSLMGALVEAAYNPKVLNLDTTPLEELKKLKVLFVFSLGYFDKDTYKKISDYVYSGGTLVTIGYPVKEYENGTTIENNVLYPAEPHLTNNVYEFGNTSVVSNITYDMANYQIYRKQIKHTHSLNTIDMIQPMAESTRYVSKYGTWLDDEKGKKVWASRFVSTWKTRNGVYPLLRYNKDSASAYYIRHGHGKSIFIGTMLGIFLDSPCYYTEERSKKDSISDFLTNILKEAGVKPLYDKIQDVEIIIREDKNSALVFIVNRGIKKDIMLNYDFHLYDTFDILFTGKESSFNKKFFDKNKTLKGSIDKDDVVVIRFY
ncbi:MAG: beta-galactosidase [Candidatus Sericytochromatia bacterium]